MKFGAYTLPAGWLPDKITIPKHNRIVAAIDTYTDTVVFSFGERILGQKILLEWDFMRSDLWDELQALELLDTEMVWDPEKAECHSLFNVQIMALEGKFFEVVDWDGPYRRDVKLELLITGETIVGS